MSETRNAFFRSVMSLRDLGLSPGTAQRLVWHLGSDVSGAPERVPVVALQGSQPGPTLWVQACIHGEEYGGSRAVTLLGQEIDPRVLCGRLLLFPAMNLLAFRERQIATPIDGGNLYRAFPGNRQGSYTSQTAHRIHEEFVAVADYAIDVHTGTSVYFCVEFTAYAAGLPGSARAEELALATGAEVVVARPIRNARDQAVFMAHAASHGIPALMISVAGHRRTDPEAVLPLKRQCLNVMRHLGMLPGGVARSLRPQRFRDIQFAHCTHGGLVVSELPPGSWVKQGQVIARLYDVFGDEVEIISCPFERAYLVETATGALYPGEFAAEFFLPAE